MRAGRPAFYALEPGGWRDYLTLLHPPYTLWHLSYVAVGAALAPHFHTDRLLWGLTAFFLAVGTTAVLPAPLAAWAPNVLFLAGAVYLMLTVRT